DNASNNDAMIEELEELVPVFSGLTIHTRCFLHIINLIAKSLIWQFDVKKQTADEALESGEAAELVELGAGINEEDVTMIEEDNVGDIGDHADKEKDNGWVNKVEELSEGERAELQCTIHPVKLALVKVRISSIP
ncbi:hypothetical protein PAXRUDRAFT_167771, partial [Paxillus rubicundulus Ve08.2h10]